METNLQTLAGLRDQIDEIDRQIHELINKRAAIAPLVIAAKGGGPIWRPAREAQVLRKRLAAHQGGLFPTPCLLGIWTELMTGMTSIEVDFCFGMVKASALDTVPTVRAHFGALPQLKAYRNPEELLAASDHAIAMLPWPQASDSQKWWPLLLQPEFRDHRIGFALPFLPSHENLAPIALIAKIALEESGDDTALLAIPRQEFANWSGLTVRIRDIDQGDDWLLVELKEPLAKIQPIIDRSSAVLIGLVPNRITV